MNNHWNAHWDPLLHFAPPILVGLILLAAGRRLFWLFIGVVGFVAAARLAFEVMGPHHDEMLLIVALVFGICGAALAILAQKLAIIVGGAIAGAFYLSTMLEGLGMQQPGRPWVSLLIGAILGAILLSLLFNWALILLSSVAGAHLVVHSLGLSAGAASLLSVTLVVIGVLVQTRLLSLHTRRDVET